MIVARILDPRSKLATARGLRRGNEERESVFAELLEVRRTDAQALLHGDGLAGGTPSRRSRRNWPNGIWKTARWCSTT